MNPKFTATRRGFLGGSAALMASAGLWYPKKAFAAGPERKFLFCFAGGGWDTTTVLDPHFDTDGVDMDPDTVLGEAGGVRYTSGIDREPLDDFMEKWHRRVAIVNGVDPRSVGHDSGTQFMLTGTSASSYADWPTLLAAKSTIEYPLPHVVFSGPSFTGTLGSAVVRAGGGTLLSLLDGSINGMSDQPAPVSSPPIDDIVDDFVYKRVADYASQQQGMAKERAEGLLANIERSMELEGRQFEAGLDDLGNSFLDQALKATEMFRLGLSRCAMIRIPGGYDSHGNNMVQAPAQVAYYQALNEVMDHMSKTPGHTTNWLIDEVTIVAMSEFGRTPKLNGGGGKDHWPYNSVFVAGAGVRGDSTLGYTDGSLVAEPVDFKTGKPSSSGDYLACDNLGMAICKIGGLDPSKLLPGVQAFDALLPG